MIPGQHYQPPPSFIAVQNIRNLLNYQGNIYDLTRAMTQWDPEIAGAVSTYGLQCAKAFRGLRLREKAIPSSLKNGNKRVIKKLKQYLPIVERHFDLPQFFHSAGYCAIRDGDVVIDARRSDRLEFLPMKYVTAVERRADIGDRTKAIFHANYYVLNEENYSLVGNQEHNKLLVIPASDIIHISVNPYGSEVLDNLGRWTYNIWSDPPLLPLRTTFLWKQNSIINDILIRHKHVPRLWIQVDFESIYPTLLEGDTPEERSEQLENAIQNKLTEIVRRSRWAEADQDLVSTSGIKFQYIQPDNYSYNAPNELLAQFTDSVTAVTGVTKGALVGDTRGNFASELILSSYSAMRAEQIAKKIGVGILPYIKKVLSILLDIEFTIDKIPEINLELLDYLYVDVRLLHKQDEDRLVRKIVQMGSLPGMFPKDFLYEELGLDPDYFKNYEPHEFYNINDYGGAGKNAKSPRGYNADTRRSAKDIEYPDTPQQEETKKAT